MSGWDGPPLVTQADHEAAQGRRVGVGPGSPGRRGQLGLSLLGRMGLGLAVSHGGSDISGVGGREADTSGRRAPIPGIAYQASTRQCLFRSNALLARTSHMAKPSVPVRGGCTRLWVLGTGDSLILHSRRGR